MIRFIGASVLAAVLGLNPAIVEATDGTGSADPVKRVPAHFGSSKRALYELLRYPASGPSTDGVHALIFCQIIVNAQGEVGAKNCGNAIQAPSQDFVATVFTALDRAQFSPARVGGQPVAVAMNLQVVFRCDDGACGPIALPNLGQHAETLGSAYISPQEIITEHNWYERVLLSELCLSGKSISEACVSEAMLNFAVRVEVDEMGHPGQVSVVRGQDAAMQGFVEAAMDEMERSSFIPAYKDGNFLPLSVVHSAIYQEDEPGITARLPRPICRKEVDAGSRLARRTCYTPLEYARKRERDAAESTEFRSGNSTIF